MISSVLILSVIVLFLALSIPGPRLLRHSMPASGGVVSEETDVRKQAKRNGTWKFVVAFICLLLGMIGTAFYKALKNGNTSFEGLGTELLLTALVSPIVFRATIAGVGGISRADWPTIVLSSYQNGFFWEIIFGEIRSQMTNAS